ncbi:hypothetical protein B0H14DRAFT_2555854 [Mycena olivaceomarginata]|nr:hypothetical protein B0H14DRAFT_2555854 [Mycena olivaceomarginata]
MVARPPRVQRTIAAILGVFDITKVPEVLSCRSGADATSPPPSPAPSGSTSRPRACRPSLRTRPGEAVDELLGEKTDEKKQREEREKEADGGGIVDGIASGMGSFVGTDQP